MTTTYRDARRRVLTKLRRLARQGKLPVAADRIYDHVPGPPMVLRDEAGHVYWTSPWRFSPDGAVWAACPSCGKDVEPSANGFRAHAEACSQGTVE